MGELYLIGGVELVPATSHELVLGLPARSSAVALAGARGPQMLNAVLVHHILAKGVQNNRQAPYRTPAYFLSSSRTILSIVSRVKKGCLPAACRQARNVARTAPEARACGGAGDPRRQAAGRLNALLLYENAPCISHGA